MTEGTPAEAHEDAGHDDGETRSGEAATLAQPDAENGAASPERDDVPDPGGQDAEGGEVSPADQDGEEGTADSDSERIARIDAYVRDQQKEGSDWLGRLATFLGLAAFFFGIGTFTDLRHYFTDSSSEPAAKTVEVQSLEISCRPFIHHELPPKDASYDALAAYNQSVLLDRDAHNFVWDSLDTSSLSDQDAEIALALKHSYFAASNFLAAAVSAAQTKDVPGYALAVGQYNEAESQFLKESADFGLASGTCSWAAADAPTVADLDRARPK